MTTATAEEIVVTEETRARIKELTDKSDEAALELGGLLFKVKSMKSWKEWGFQSFDDYVESEVRFRRRKAYYLISIWEKYIVDLKLDPAKVLEIGWSKARELVSVVTEDNWKTWFKQAKKATVGDLKEAVKKDQDSAPGAAEAARIWSIALFPNQKKTVEEAIEAATEESESDKKGHALECVCLAYLATRSEGADKKERLEQLLAGIERTYGQFVIATGSTKVRDVMLKAAEDYISGGGDTSNDAEDEQDDEEEEADDDTESLDDENE